MPSVHVRIIHLALVEDTGELGALVAQARSIVASHLAGRFAAAGADDVEVVAGRRGEPFGRLLRELSAVDGGLVVLGSGSIPLAGDDDLEALVGHARDGAGALTNNRYSSDVVAVAAAALRDVPETLPNDNLVPRWLASAAGIHVTELPDRQRLALDVDSPLDLELLRRHPACPAPLAALAHRERHRFGGIIERLEALAVLARDPSAELLVAGRLSSATLRRLERSTAARIRALVEERGMKAGGRLGAGETEPGRPPASVLGLLLDAAGPDGLADVVGRLADGAVLDSRVLLAHRLGGDEACWPSAEDRFAADLLLADQIGDSWLHRLTESAAAARAPIALGGHTLVGPGIGLALGLEPAFETP